MTLLITAQGLSAFHNHHLVHRRPKALRVPQNTSTGLCLEIVTGTCAETLATGQGRLRLFRVPAYAEVVIISIIQHPYLELVSHRPTTALNIRRHNKTHVVADIPPAPWIKHLKLNRFVSGYYFGYMSDLRVRRTIISINRIYIGSEAVTCLA